MFKTNSDGMHYSLLHASPFILLKLIMQEQMHKETWNDMPNSKYRTAQLVMELCDNVFLRVI